jgi:hypothetical protein
MELNKINNKIGIFAGIFLIFLLFQNYYLNFLINSSLGRLILIFLILATSTFSNLLSVICVLIVIILMNQNDQIYLEGFENNNDISTALSSSLAASSNFYNVGGNMQKQSREGFNIIENERNMLLGKKSKEIFVNANFDKSTENVEPFSS